VPDGVLLDLSMPEMDGDAVLVAMRQDPRLKDVPVVVISTESQRARDTLRLGADDFLPKPITADALRRSVAGMLEAAALRRANLLRAFLFFRAGGLDLGLPLDSVHTVTARPALQTLPGAPAYVPGYFELYGEAVAVLDLAMRLGREHPQSPRERKVVVVDCRGTKIGLETDDVWDPEGLEHEAVLGEGRFAAPYEGIRDRVECLARGSRGLVPVLRAAGLLDEGELEALRAGLSSVAQA
jgi:chemotaxis signal transduction protein